MPFLAPLIPILIKIAVAVAVQLVTSLIFKKKPEESEGLDFEQTVTRNIDIGDPLTVLFGRRIIAGHAYFDDSRGYKREYAHNVTVLSAKPCTAFHKLYGDGEALTLSGDPTLGWVNVTSHFLGKPTNAGNPLSGPPRLRVRLYLGDNNAGLGAVLAGFFPNNFSAGDDFGDYCVLLVEGRNTNDDLDEEDGKNYIPFQGRLPIIRVEMSGAAVPDPRDPGCVYGDETTYSSAASDVGNAALVDAYLDYGVYSGDAGPGRALIAGNGYPIEFLNMDRIKQSADYWDAQGFTFGGEVRSGQQGDLAEVRRTFAGDRVENGATVYTVPEADRDFNRTIDLANYPSARITSWDREGLSTEVPNVIRTVYAEPSENYVKKDLPAFTKPEWIAADNHVPREQPLNLLMVTSLAGASALQEIYAQTQRAAGAITIEGLPFNFAAVPEGDTVTVVNSDIPSANNRTWIVKGAGNDPGGNVTLALAEYGGPFAAPVVPTIPITLPTVRPWPWREPPPYVGPGTIIGIGGRLDATDINLAQASSDIAGLAGSLDVQVAPAALSGIVPSGSTEITTGPVQVTVQGGVAPYTYVFTPVSGDSFTVGNPNPNEAEFTGGPGSGVYQVEVTDSTGGTPLVRTKDFSVTHTAQGGGAAEITLELSPFFLSATIPIGLGPITTADLTVTPSGGVAPYTYVFTKLDGVASHVAAHPATNKINVTGGVGLSSWRVTVTDSSPTPLTKAQDFGVTINIEGNN